MIESVLLLDGQSIDSEKVRAVSLANAKQLVWGRFAKTGIIVHVAATASTDLQKAIMQFSQVPAVTSVITLAIREG
jgi:hypothetical protein